jgi:hypothetical protein
MARGPDMRETEKTDLIRHQSPKLDDSVVTAFYLSREQFSIYILMTQYLLAKEICVCVVMPFYLRQVVIGPNNGLNMVSRFSGKGGIYSLLFENF